MRNFRILTAALFGLGATIPASAQSFTAIGNSIEMYLDRSCSVGGTCLQAFPQNTTGRIIKINYVSCEVIIASSSNRLVFAAIGPSATSTGLSLVKETFFDSHRFITNGSDNTVNYLSATPGLLLGTGRYLAVRVVPTGGVVQMKCAAAGVFAN